MASNARLFYDKILAEADRYAYLQGLVRVEAPYVFEEEWLEFKGDARTDVNALKIWSKCVSAFANTEGGVVVWGIDAREDSATRIDYASGFRLIPNPSRLRSLLAEHQHTITDPPVSGIEMQEVIGSDGTGFLLCYVPESNNKPHRSERETNKPFYIRAGSHNHVVGVSLLRSMFYPKARSNPVLVATPKWDEVTGRVSLTCRLINNGDFTLKDVFFSIRNQGTRVAINSINSFDSDSEKGYKGMGLHQALHPGASKRFAEVSSVNTTSLPIYTRQEKSAYPGFEIQLRITMYALDCPPVLFSLHVFGEQVAEGRELFFEKVS